MNSIKNPASEGTFEFPPSIQSDLFNYLKPEQQEYIRPILRMMKKSAQEQLCTSLLDYMETGEVIMSENAVVDGMFIYLTRYNMPEEIPSTGSGQAHYDKRIICPLHYRSRSPQKIGEIINRLFPKLPKSLTPVGEPVESTTL